MAVTHRNLVISLHARLQYYPEPVSRFLLTFSLAFDGSVTGIFWTLLQGGQLVIPSEATHRDPTELAALDRTSPHLACRVGAFFIPCRAR